MADKPPECGQKECRSGMFGYAAHNRGLLIVLCATVVLGFIVVTYLISQGTPGDILMASAGFWVRVFPPTLVLFLLLCWVKNRICSLAATVLFSLLLFLLLLIPANIIGFYLAGRPLDKSFAISKTISSQLESYHRTHGEYPSTLEVLGRNGFHVELPPLAKSGFYTSYGDRYTLFFQNAPGFDGSWTFYSGSDRWDCNER